MPRGIQRLTQVRAAQKIGGNGFGDAGLGAAGGISIKRASDVVRKSRHAVAGDADEVRIRAGRELRCYAEATVVFVEIEVSAPGVTEVAEVVVVFHVPPERVAGADARTALRGGDTISTDRPRGNVSPSDHCKILGTVLAIAQNVSAPHAGSSARGICGTDIPVGPINGVTIPHPAEYR